MPEYVYGLHDFTPENEDEIPFRAGERIEVIEKDDEYGDGWWQGRNLAGKAGLFPQSYTTPSPSIAPDEAPDETAAIPPPSSANDSAIVQNGAYPNAPVQLDPAPESPDSDRAGDLQQHLLHTLAEESEPESVGAPVLANGHTPNGDTASVSQSGGVMDATMTDVQKAIEQLGRRRDDGDGDRSFSFASTGDDNSLRYDDTGGETDETDFEEGGEGWHKGARRKLAEKARRAVKEAEKLEMLGSTEDAGKERLVAPPIDVEMSDESEDEHDDVYDHEHTAQRSYLRAHANIPEESEEEDGITNEFGSRGAGSTRGHIDDGDNDTRTRSALSSSTAHGTGTTTSTYTAQGSSRQSLEVPPEENEIPTATRATFDTMAAPAPISVPLSATGIQTFVQIAQDKQEKDLTPTELVPPQASLPTPISPPPVPRSRSTPPRGNSRSQEIMMPIPMTSSPSSTTVADNRTSSPAAVYRESLIALPSPTASSVGFGSGAGASPFGHGSQTQSKHTSSASSVPGSMAGAGALAGAGSAPAAEERKSQDRVHPSEWSVDDVVDWLKSRGFDQDVCEKFTEQEITGDVLLELDANLLKTEIGILAFGKRVRIANAITELRRPPSFIYDRLSAPSSPMHPQMTQSSHSQMYSPPSQTQSPPLMQSPPFNAHSPLHSALSAHNLGQAYTSGVPIPAPGGAYQSAGAYPGSGNNSVNGAHGSHAHTRQLSQAYSVGTYNSFPQSLHSPGGFGGSTNGFPGGPGSEAGGSAAGPTDETQTSTVHTGSDETDNISNKKPLPGHLNTSPSDSALGAAAKAPAEAEAEEEKALSESEAGPPSSVRRRFFGGSARNSGSSFKDKPDRTSKDKSDRTSKDKPDRTSKDSASSPPLSTSPTLRDSEKDKDGSSVGSRHVRNKRSLDAKPSDRLSLFGSIGGSLGKSRKPPPRYSAALDEPHEKSSLSLSRFAKKVAAPRSASDTSPKTSPKARDTGSVKESKEKDKDPIHPSLLRKRTMSTHNPKSPESSAIPSPLTSPLGTGDFKAGQSILEQIGEPDHNGWMRKKSDRYNSWKMRYFILKGPHLYCLRSNSKSETKIKGYINIVGYKVTVDENVDPGRYGFKIEHDDDKTHYFSSEEKTVIRDWMKAIMKATIGRDYTKPVVSSCNIPTIPLTVAQAMNPAPRPPSPTARDATQKALRRENPHQLSSRDARVLMGLPSEGKDDKTRVETVFANEADSEAATPTLPRSPAPPRPTREARRLSSQPSIPALDDGLIDWANGHLPASMQITDPTGPLCNGLGLLRLAESIKGRPSSPPVPDSAFPLDPNDDKLDGLFRLFDFLLDNDVKMGSVSINDVRQGKREKIVQLLRALKAWEDKRKAIAQSIGKSSVQAGGFMAPVGSWSGM